MSDSNLPLFDWQPPRRVLVFPLINRTSKIRHTASMLSNKHGEEARLYWKQVVASNRKSLGRVGLSNSEIDHELTAFFDAVQQELVRQSYEGRPNSNGNPGGVA